MTAPSPEVVAVLAALAQKNAEPALAAEGDAAIAHLDSEAAGVYGSVFDAVISSNGVGTGAALVAALDALDIDAAEVNARIVALSTDQIRAGLPRPTAPDCPDLPDAVQIDEAAAKTVGHYVDEYVAYAGARSPRTPDLYHESAALMLGSIGIARRVVLLMAFDDVYPNLAVIWIARSTLFAKTTALRIAQGIAYDVFPHLTLPHDSTMEALVAELAGREPEKFDQMPDSDQTIWTTGRNFAAQRAIVLDEFAGLMETAKKDYGGGLEEMLLRLYDCVDFYTRNTRGQGRVTINNAYLPILGASTPGGMAPFLGKPRAWEKGLWARIALLVPESAAVYVEPRDVSRPHILTDALTSIQERLPQPVWPESRPPVEAILDDDALQLWKRYEHGLWTFTANGTIDPRLDAQYGRLPSQALKIAIILATFDWSAASNHPRITAAHMHRALLTAERWRRSAHRALQTAARSAYRSNRERVERVIKKDAKGATLRTIGRLLPDLEPRELQEIMGVLVAENSVEECATAGKVGRPTSYFKWVAP